MLSLRQLIFFNVESKRAIRLAALRIGKMFEPMEQATGIEKKEIESNKEGCQDPFAIRNIITRGQSTYDCPTLIPSSFEGRLVGCICHRYQRYVCWMWLEKDFPKRCECGHWFKLREVEPFYSQ